MKFWTYIAFLVPFIAFSQQTVEICGEPKSFTYSTESDIDATVEWYVLGAYYYGNSITLQWDTPGVFNITATATAEDCPGTPQTYTVTVTECDPVVWWVPNTFTPNGDEYNTTWGPVFSGPFDQADFHVTVFTRWGNLIWESRDATARWDGMCGSRAVHDGVYTWVVEFGILNTDERKLIHGHVTILR